MFFKANGYLLGMVLRRSFLTLAGGSLCRLLSLFWDRWFPKLFLLEKRRDQGKRQGGERPLAARLLHVARDDLHSLVYWRKTIQASKTMKRMAGGVFILQNPWDLRRPFVFFLRPLKNRLVFDVSFWEAFSCHLRPCPPYSQLAAPVLRFCVAGWFAVATRDETRWRLLFLVVLMVSFAVYWWFLGFRFWLFVFLEEFGVKPLGGAIGWSVGRSVGWFEVLKGFCCHDAVRRKRKKGRTARPTTFETICSVSKLF